MLSDFTRGKPSLISSSFSCWCAINGSRWFITISAQAHWGLLPVCLQVAFTLCENFPPFTLYPLLWFHLNNPYFQTTVLCYIWRIWTLMYLFEWARDKIMLKVQPQTSPKSMNLMWIWLNSGQHCEPPDIKQHTTNGIINEQFSSGE